MSNKNPKVDKWFETYENPLKDLVMEVRLIVLLADERVTEDIKWQAPTFIYKGNIASFFPKSKKSVSLMFHKGAILEDPDGLLEGDGKTSRVARFYDASDIRKNKNALKKVIKRWIKLMDSK